MGKEKNVRRTIGSITPRLKNEFVGFYTTTVPNPHSELFISS